MCVGSVQIVFNICSQMLGLRVRPLRVDMFLHQNLCCGDGLNCSYIVCQVYKGLKDVPGLNPVIPSGVMYMMVRYLCTIHVLLSLNTSFLFILYLSILFSLYILFSYLLLRNVFSLGLTRPYAKLKLNIHFVVLCTVKRQKKSLWLLPTYCELVLA